MTHPKRKCALTWLPEVQGAGPATLEGEQGFSNDSLPHVVKLQDGPSPCLPSPIVQAEGDPGQEEAITVIQSVLQAHLARIRHR